MGGRGSRSGMTTGTSTLGGGNPGPVNPIQMITQPPNVVPTVSAAQAANNAQFPDTDNSPYHDLYNGRQYYMNQNLTADQINATIQYLRTDDDYDPQHSMSQVMNQLMSDNAAAGKSVTDGMNANQRYTYRHLMSAMHNLGYNVNLTRYDHPGMVNRLLSEAGIKNADYSRLSESQLRSLLTGRTYGEEKFVSTSYNDFKNARTPQNVNTFMRRAVKLEYHAAARTQAMMPGNGPGGAIGEVLIAPSNGRQNYRITGLHFDHSVSVRQQGTAGSSRQPQLVLEVEVD